MSTAPVKSLIDEQLEQIERTLAVISFGIPFNEAVGLPREISVQSLTRSLGVTMKGRRIAIRVRP
ncbi:hypothetical protein QUC26_12640 [Pseudomonas asiatica]|uniref:hypothetical protein n=1 Tax=Pseudomonas asiatica TaxID=2219225 RepID=UPI0018D65E3D|nr:hypothetical protein [Pseudomonas asiatica]MBH3377144.1 hypothetical protein [Pseudomonas asiatica]WJM55930.1 hypothetical protein QUC26_12640 [Pseudomonas asiatica]